jgi:DUF1009 family protein
MSAVGIIAGGGVLPLDCIRSLNQAGNASIVAAHIGDTSKEVEAIANQVVWVRVGQLGKISRFFKKHNVKRVYFAGGLKRARIFTSFFPDLHAIKIILRVKTHHDDSILSGVCKFFESRGFEIGHIGEILLNYLPSAGVYTANSFTEAERETIKIGIEAARKLGELDIGQAVMVADKTVVAVEAVEGTELMISRVASLGIPNTILIKMSKPTQDLRVDLPSIGPDTIKQLKNAKARGVVIESQRSLMLEPEKTIAEANREGIIVEVW